jgi:hypothetical protein
MTATDTPGLTPAQAVSAADRNAFVSRVAEYASRVLRPSALRVDREGVSAERIQELRALGLLNHLAPAEFGGQADSLDQAADRRLHELVAGACLNTWLVWAQHAPLVSVQAASAAAGTPLSDLAQRALRGEVLFGAGISDVRRCPGRFIAAQRTGAGWTFSGVLSWVSGWGLNSVLTIAAVQPDTQTVVTALVPVDERTRATPLDLSVAGGSHTVRVVLDDVVVPDEHVISTRTLEDWRIGDIAVASDARPHHFGIAQTVLDELRHDSHPLAPQVAQTWAPRVEQIRSDAYGLADEAVAAGGGPYRLDERLATKVASADALSVLTRALLAARAGHGLGHDDTAQLHARSALFVLVQGQNDDVRRAQLASYTH